MTEAIDARGASEDKYEQQTLTPGLAQSLGTLSAAAIESRIDPEVLLPVDAFGYVSPAAAAAIEAQKERAKIEAARVEAIKVLDKDNFKLSDLNPLIHVTDLARKESTDAVRLTVLDKIADYGGRAPEVLESAVVTDLESGKSDLRFIARFEVPTLSEEQICLLEEIVKQTYGVTVRTRMDSKGNEIPPQSYPPTQMGEELKSKTGGWYMGPAPVPTSGLNQGLFLFKDYGPINRANFLDDSDMHRKYIVEIREAGLYQTDLVSFVTQVSAVLGNAEMLDRGKLLYETYYDLIRLGLKSEKDVAMHGMEEAEDMIRRELIMPLANPEISRGLYEEPQSVLMIGVPGTGKTLMVEHLLQEDTGLFVLPIDPFELQKELAKPKDKQFLMARISEVARITGRKVVMHVDDIENMVTADEVTNSTMLNLMAGVQESGFYVIASSNFPEKINPSLIQPQRFSVLIHCGLQNDKARYEILKIHANMKSLKRELPLFESEEIRDIILTAVSARTSGFTPRYLANIATVAKSHLLNRVSKEKHKMTGLTEDDLIGAAFTLEDWEKALVEVSAKYDSRSVKERDQELGLFVKKHVSRSVGFGQESDQEQHIFPRSIGQKIVAAQTRVMRSKIQDIESTE